MMAAFHIIFRLVFIYYFLNWLYILYLIFFVVSLNLKTAKSGSWILYLLGLFSLGSIYLYISWNVPCQPSSKPWHPGTIPFLFVLLLCGSYTVREQKVKIGLSYSSGFISRVFFIFNICFSMFPIFHENYLPCLPASALYFSGGHSVHIHQLWLWQAKARVS
jgi:hypothetical protein